MNSLCVVFDIDDTLYLERDYVFSGFAAIGRWAKTWLRVDDLEAHCRSSYESGVRKSIFNQALTTCGVECNDDLITAAVNIYRAHEPVIALCADAEAALSTITAKWPAAVISDGPAMSQMRKVEALGLRRFASPVIVTELLGRQFSKPHEAAYLRVHDAIPAQRYVYIADNPSKDFIAPRALGWASIRVRRPAGHYSALENGVVEPDFEMTDLSGLDRILLTLLSRCP